MQDSTLAQEVVKFISRHFSDSRIANPDYKETYLTRLNYVMQFQHYIDLLQNTEYSSKNLIPVLLRSFDKRYLLLVCKNFLRFAKCRGFKEISLVGQVQGIEDTYSEFFLKQIREELLQTQDKTSKEFMNVFFNTLNELTTEIFVIFKELKNSYSPNILKRTKNLSQIIVDMYRMLEIMTKWVPEIFVDKTQIHSIRLINYLMFVL